MKRLYFISALAVIVLLNIASHWLVLRIDMTQDKRFSLSQTTKQMLRSMDKVEATVYLKGDFNSGFTRLGEATRQIMEEMSVYGDMTYRFVNPNTLTDKERNALNEQLLRHNLHPTAIYETNKNGSSSETIVYPFVRLTSPDPQKGGEQWVSLLQNRRDLSGAENLNHSIENLEYAFALGITNLQKAERDKIVFLEGQGELPEQNTQDVQTALADYFDVYRGSLTASSDCLSPFSAVIVADPQTAFSEAEKYSLDQYIMHGGRVLWLVNGVRFSNQVLTDEGFTPVLVNDVNLTDMLFRYGVRINNRLVSDMQCLSIPVDISRDADRPQYQPMPWQYAPLLLTSSESAVSTNLSPVSATFCSDLSAVGDTADITRTVLLATSQTSRVTPVPGEVNLSDLSIDPRMFTQSFLPVAMSLEGKFASVFAHRMPPEGISEATEKLTESKPTKQIVVASGSVISNDIQQGQPLPAGYDRYSHIQFSNRDFIVNSVLWLTDYSNLLDLRQKSIPLRMLNANTVKNGITLIAFCGLGLPLLLLFAAGIIIFIARKRKYAK